MKRLTPAKVTMIMFFVVGGLIVAYIAKGLMAVPEKKAGPKSRNVPMPIADLLPGTVITEDHLGLGPVLESDLQRDMLLANKVIVGRVVKERLKAAYPIRSSQLYEPGSYPPLKLAKGMRAVTLDASNMQSIVDGLIKPGDYVDVHFTPSGYVNDPRIRGGMTMTMFKGVKILAMNRMMIQGQLARDHNTITLELSPEQANILILARDRGHLTLSLNPQGKGDGQIALADKDRATLEEILGLEPIKKPAPPAPPPPPFVSQLYRGTRRQEMRFDRQGGIREVYGNTYGPPAAPLPQQPLANPPAGQDPTAPQVNAPYGNPATGNPATSNPGGNNPSNGNPAAPQGAPGAALPPVDMPLNNGYLFPSV